MLLCVIAAAPLLALGPRIVAHIPESWDTVLRFGYYPMLILGLVLAVTALYRASLPDPLPTHRLVWGALLATAVFVVATAGLRVYLQYITRTGYTYGALATPIAFLLFAFFLGFAIMIGAELNSAIQEEWPAPEPHWQRWRARWRGEFAEPAGDAETPVAARDIPREPPAVINSS
jgi:membrane protein